MTNKWRKMMKKKKISPLLIMPLFLLSLPLLLFSLSLLIPAPVRLLTPSEWASLLCIYSCCWKNKSVCTQVCNDKRNCKYICHSWSHSGTMFKKTTDDERHHREKQKKKRLKDRDGQSGGWSGGEMRGWMGGWRWRGWRGWLALDQR